MAPSLSVVIPTLNAAGEIDELLTLIETQTLRPFDILVVDSSSEDGTVDEVAKHPRVNFVRIERKEFNHGSTRDIALRRTAGDFVCFLTQDAVPASSRYLETLVEPLLADNSVALVSGRQLPKANARRFEQLVRDFNYPDTPSVRSKGDLEKFGIKTFFASDTCSAYRRDRISRMRWIRSCQHQRGHAHGRQVYRLGYEGRLRAACRGLSLAQLDAIPTVCPQPCRRFLSRNACGRPHAGK